MKNQYEPLVTPSGWSGDEKRFAVRLTQILDELYTRVGTLRSSSNSLGKEKLDASKIANALDVEEEGYVLDARQGKELAGRIDRAASMLYPVGSIYLSVNETDPAALFGGVWERLEDVFLLAAGDSFAPGSTGGEAEVQLTAEQMPKHTHGGLFRTDGTQLSLSSGQGGEQLELTGNESVSEYAEVWTGYAGEDATHNNMPPYLAVYAWKRVE